LQPHPYIIGRRKISKQETRPRDRGGILEWRPPLQINLNPPISSPNIYYKMTFLTFWNTKQNILTFSDDVVGISVTPPFH
jgi:hypothetical protein